MAGSRVERNPIRVKGREPREAVRREAEPLRTRYFYLTEGELLALQDEAGKLRALVEALSNPKFAEKMEGWGAGSASYYFCSKMTWFADAFEKMNEREVTPAALAVQRTDYVVRDGSGGPGDKYMRFHATSGADVGQQLSYTDVYEWFSGFFCTNYDEETREGKRQELIGTLLNNKFVVICGHPDIY